MSRAVSPFSCSFERNARDMKMTTGVAEGVRWERHSSEESLQSPIRIEINPVDGAIRRLNNRDLVILTGVIRIMSGKTPYHATLLLYDLYKKQQQQQFPGHKLSTSHIDIRNFV